MKKLFNIKSNVNFLRYLAEYILNNYNELNRLEIILPTRRAVRKLKTELVKQNNGKSIILPNICAITDIGSNDINFLAIPNAVNQFDAQIKLTEIIENYFKDKEVKPSFKNAYLLANNIYNLLDEIEAEIADFNKLHTAVPGDFAQHWLENLDFIKYCHTEFYDYLTAKNQVLPSKRVNLLLEKKLELIHHPLIIAGSTASNPATKDFIIKALKHSNVKVFLPNFIPKKEQPSANHHQYNLYNLIHELTEKIENIDSELLTDLNLYEANSAADESLFISLKIREILEHNQNANIGVITNSKSQETSIYYNLKRFGLELDIFSGTPLNQTLMGKKLLLLVKILKDNFRLIDILSYLKLLNKNTTELEVYIRKNGLFKLAQIEVKYPDIFTRFDNLKNTTHKLNKLIEFLNSDDEDFYNSEEASTFMALIDNISNLKSIKLDTYKKLYEALNTLLSGEVYNPPPKFQNNIEILSPLEARLHNYNYVFFAGLYSGNMPSAITANFLNNTMREEIGLPEMEKKTGLEAHDFYSLIFGAKTAFISYPKKLNSSTSCVASNWLIKLQKDYEINNITAQASKINKAYLNEHPKITYPEAVGIVPDNIELFQETYATNIEQLMANPYGYYAKNILGLRKLSPQAEDYNLADFGNIVHEILEEYLKLKKALPLDEIIQDKLKAVEKTTRKIWLPKIQKIAKWFLKQNIADEVTVEQKFTAELGNYILCAKIDRLDLTQQSAKIIDYKTGYIPAQSEIAKGEKPQMIIEALIIQNSNLNINIIEAEYWKLSAKDNASHIKKIKDIENLTTEAQIGIKNLLDHFVNTRTFELYPIPSRIPKYDDYAHLARVDEN